MNQVKTFDFIIVGAGSAGCVLANRLSANPDLRICLIEAGPKDSNPAIHIPMGLAALSKFKSLSWGYETQPQSSLDGRAMYMPRGKVLGGSSSVNAMCYIRGDKSDYDMWEQQGAEGWNWDAVLPYFKRSEQQLWGESELHGADGPLSVSDLRHTNSVSQAFIDSAEKAGFSKVRDFNSEQREGVGFYQVTQKNGQRCSAAVAYLRPAQARQNLTIIDSAHVTNLVMDGVRCVGVDCITKGSKERLFCTREVILSAGAYNSPQLLLLSGIGPSQQLNEKGVEVVIDRPGVGENLQDHLDIIIQHKLKKPIGYGLSPFALPSYIRAAWQYWHRRQGMLTSNVAEAGGFVRSSLSEHVPDLQFHFLPALLVDHGRKTAFGFGCSLHVCFLYPKSRGRVALASKKWQDKPLIDPNFLSHEMDRQVMVEAVKLSRTILTCEPISSLLENEIAPGQDVQSEDEIMDFVKEKSETIYHPIGTCKMGRVNDPFAVVNSQLQVIGTDGLRVIDASVMPTLIGGNTNAPTIMIAEKAADMILSQLA